MTALASSLLADCRLVAFAIVQSERDAFLFAGRAGYQEDGDTGLKLLGHRYYDASTGRFLTRDPAKDGRNWYAYCDGNPLGSVDPSGFSVWGWADDRWVEFSAWVSGRDTTDPNGHPVRIGGWPAIGNKPGNGMTVGGTIHFEDERTYGNYVKDPHWQNHEEGHIDQDFGLKDFPKYAFCHLIGVLHEYVTPTGKPSRGGDSGHDYNWFEWDAEVRAEKKDGIWDLGSPRHGF